MIKGVALVVAVFSVIVGSVLYASNAYLVYMCDEYSRVSGKETLVSPLNACFVRHDGEWLRFDEYKLRMAALEGLLGDN